MERIHNLSSPSIPGGSRKSRRASFTYLCSETSFQTDCITASWRTRQVCYLPLAPLPHPTFLFAAGRRDELPGASSWGIQTPRVSEQHLALPSPNCASACPGWAVRERDICDIWWQSSLIRLSLHRTGKPGPQLISHVRPALCLLELY